MRLPTDLQNTHYKYKKWVVDKRSGKFKNSPETAPNDQPNISHPQTERPQYESFSPFNARHRSLDYPDRDEDHIQIVHSKH